MHDMLVGDVRVGEDDLIDVSLRDQSGELVLGQDRNPVGISRPRERGRVGPVGDPGDLRRREGDDLDLGIVAIDDVEVVEVAAPGSHDQHSAHRGDSLGAEAP